MSVGNPFVKCRVTPELLNRIWVQIESRNLVTRDEPWDLAGFVRTAIVRMLVEMERKRTYKKKPKGSKNSKSIKAEGKPAR